MFRISVLLMAILLIFSTMPVSLAQQDSVQAQAEADASVDMSDMLKAKWFVLGAAGSTAGCLLGCVGGYMLGGPSYEFHARRFCPFRCLRRANCCFQVPTQGNTTPGATSRQIPGIY
ncbi:hypothetical protein J4G07_19795 [Candidatus Poribacteria bacterium]|nr:hypothetical protein [Candidatus Poribacteria bacterium]